MVPNVSITSIEFTSRGPGNIAINDDMMNSIRLNYSDGETKLFENINPNSGKAWKTYNHGTIYFDESNPVRAVKAYSSALPGVRAFRFLDEQHNLISEWNIVNRNVGVTYDIAENEEIIGVYGNQNNGK